MLYLQLFSTSLGLLSNLDFTEKAAAVSTKQNAVSRETGPLRRLSFRLARSKRQSKPDVV